MSLGCTGTRRVVLGHTLNTLRHVITKTSQKVLSKFTISCGAAFTALPGCTRPAGRRFHTPAGLHRRCLLPRFNPCADGRDPPQSTPLPPDRESPRPSVCPELVGTARAGPRLGVRLSLNRADVRDRNTDWPTYERTRDCPSDPPTGPWEGPKPSRSRWWGRRQDAAGGGHLQSTHLRSRGSLLTGWKGSDELAAPSAWLCGGLALGVGLVAESQCPMLPTEPQEPSLLRVPDLPCPRTLPLGALLPTRGGFWGARLKTPHVSESARLVHPPASVTSAPDGSCHFECCAQAPEAQPARACAAPAGPEDKGPGAARTPWGQQTAASEPELASQEEATCPPRNLRVSLPQEST